MKAFQFITHRPLWVNILAGIILALLFFFILLFSLKWVTSHGKSATVPAVTGKTFEEARDLLKKQGFVVDIQDSIYVDTVAPLTVIRQIPDADEIVKSNRTVYLVINRAVPPMVEMPNLLGYSYRNAEMSLNNTGLKMGDTIFKPDFAKNAVLEQLYQGRVITPGTKIRKGSVITLVLGDGVGNREFVVPVITGMRFCDARTMLEQNGIVIGAIVPDPNVEDTCNAYIYRQNPEKYDEDKRLQRIRPGQTMDVWLSTDKPARDSAGAEDDPGFPGTPDDPIFKP